MTLELAQNGPPVTAGVIRVCSLDEIPVGLGRGFDIAGKRIALFRTRRGGVFAVDNRCPHKGGSLADGMLAGDAVVCPLHAFRYELSNGLCDQPGACNIKAYPIELRGNQVFLLLENPEAA